MQTAFNYNVILYNATSIIMWSYITQTALYAILYNANSITM